MTPQEYYRNQYIDIHSKFKTVLDLLSHLNENFPKMADNHRDIEEKKIQKYLTDLKIQNKPVYDEATATLRNFESGLGYDLETMSKKGLEVFIKLIDHKAIHQHSQQFMREMALAYMITTFEEFLKTTITIASSLGVKTKDKWNSLTEEEKEKQLFEFLRLDIKERSVEIRKNFGLDLKKEPDWKDFAECFYRRNMIIHNRGIPDKTYKDRTGYRGKDTKLIVDKTYLDNAIKIYKKFSENIEEYFIETQLFMVNITKKSNIVHIDLIKDGGQIISLGDESKNSSK